MQIFVSRDYTFQRLILKFLASILHSLRIQLLLRGNIALEDFQSPPELCRDFLFPGSPPPPRFSLSIMIFSAFSPYLELENVLQVAAACDSQLSPLKFFLLWNLSPSNSHCLNTFLLLPKSRSSQTFSDWSTSDQDSQRPCSEIHPCICITATLSCVALSQ